MTDTPLSRLTLIRPDDWHVHLRDGAMLAAVLPHTARAFARAIVMPNLKSPVTTAALARAYRQRIEAALPQGAAFTPLMTAYLTDATDPDDLARGFEDGTLTAAKLYPAHATTNAAAGVTDIARIASVLERMEAIDMPLLVHGEATHPEIDIFDRESVFIEETLLPLRARHPALRIVFEHITTEEAAQLVQESNPALLAATITAHHLVLNRTDMFRGGIRPHHYCLPVPKRERHRLALVRAATSGHPGFFLGTDSAPHPVGDKESACGCAGLFTAPAALETYADIFAQENALDRLEAFASLNGPRFYKLPVNQARVALVRGTGLKVPERVGEVLPFRAGETLGWQLLDQIEAAA